MSKKAYFLDYEPVTPAGTQTPKEAPDEFWPIDRPVPSAPARVAKPEPRKHARKSAVDQGLSQVLKHGHAISFVGLVIFTLLLDFRPYELFPELAWAKSSAFWVALLTLIFYLPSQL